MLINWGAIKKRTIAVNCAFSRLEWQKKNKTIAKMLYDHKIDPDENRNLAVESEYNQIVDSLSILLNQKILKN